MKIGKKDGEKCNFNGCDGTMKFKRYDYDYRRNINNKYDVCLCSKCGIRQVTLSKNKD